MKEIKILVINGVNLNMLGIREKELYGEGSYADLVKYIKSAERENSDNSKIVNIDVVQSNYEGGLVEFIQQAYGVYDGIVINAGAYTHTSIAILDALKAVNILTVEVHLTEIYAREEFRKQSYVSLYAKKTITGMGFSGYKQAIDFLVKEFQ